MAKTLRHSMKQIYGSTAVNGVWIVPGTHKGGRVDIVKLIKETGSERLADAVPIICNPGDVVIRRSSVLNVMGAGIHADAAVFDAAFIKERSRLIGLAIDARRQRFPDETPYDYEPFKGETYIWDAAAQASLKDYNLKDLSI